MSTRVQFTIGKYQDVLKAMLGLSGPYGFDARASAARAGEASRLVIEWLRLCIDMHTKDARHAGETEQRLYLVSVWREAPMYSDRERAALAWTEAVTKLRKSPGSGRGL